MNIFNNLLQLLLIYFITYALFYYVGIGISSFILNHRFKKYKSLLIPTIGFAILASLSQFFYFFKLKSIYILILIIIIASIINFISIKTKKIDFKFEKDDFLILALNFILLIFLSIPLILHGCNFTTTVTDIFVYSTSADYVQKYGLNPVNLNNAFNSYGYKCFAMNSQRLGLVYTQSFINILTYLDSSYTFLPLSLIFANLSILNSYVLLIHNKLCKKRYAYLFTILAYLNTLYLSGVFRGFMSQISVMPFFILLVIIIVDLINNYKDYNYLTLLSIPILIGAVLAVYYSYWAYILLLLTIYTFLTILKPHLRCCINNFGSRFRLPLIKDGRLETSKMLIKNRRSLNNFKLVYKDVLINLIHLVVFQIALSFKSISLLISWIGRTYFPSSLVNNIDDVRKAGDINYFIPIYELTGISPHFHEKIKLDLWRGYKRLFTHFFNNTTATKLSFLLEGIFYLITFFIILLIIKYLIETFNTKGGLIFISILFTYLTAAIVTAIQQYTYGFYKNASTFSIFFIMIFICSISYFLEKYNNNIFYKKISHIFIVIVTILNFSSTLFILNNTSTRINELNSLGFHELEKLTDSLHESDKILSIEQVPIFQLTEQFYVKKPILIFKEPYGDINPKKF